MDLKISGIYKIQSKCKPSRIYIGSAVNIKKRWQYHLQDLRNNKHHSEKLQRHFNKYNEEDLSFSILLGCPIEDLIKTEQYFIDSCKPWFNICKIAGSPLGVKHSKETRRRFSIAHLGRTPWNKGKKLPPLSNETKAKMRASNTRPFMGKKHTEESKNKMSAALTGRPGPWTGKKRGPQSPEVIKKRTESLKAAWLKRTNRSRSEEVKQKLREASIKNGSIPPSRLGKKDSELTLQRKREAQRLRRLKEAEKNGFINSQEQKAS